jgi:hypothetical protein
VLEVVAHIVLEVVCVTIGHLILWAVTLGRWDVANGRDAAATVVGTLFPGRGGGESVVRDSEVAIKDWSEWPAHRCPDGHSGRVGNLVGGP